MNTRIRLAPQAFVLLVLATLAVHIVLVIVTNSSSFGLSYARHPERWAMWRVVLVGGWLTIALLVFELRKRQAYKETFLQSLGAGGTVALGLAIVWASISGRYVILASGAVYALIAALMGANFERSLVARVVAILLVLVQIITDIVVLGLVGQFKLH